MRQNVVQHEAGQQGLSHYRQFKDAIELPEFDFGLAAESVTIAGSLSDDAFADAAATALNDVIMQIYARTHLEPCPDASYDGSTGVCRFLGWANYEPYAACQ